jgi:hypothetical protein
MSSAEGYLEEICNRYDAWFAGFIEKAKEERMREKLGGER